MAKLKFGDTGSCPAMYKTQEFIGLPREVSSQGKFQKPSTDFTFSLPSNATNVDAYGLSHAFDYCKNLTSVDLSSLTTVSGNSAFDHAFDYCTGLTSVDLSSLTTVSGSNSFYYAFDRCSNLTSIDLSSLTTVSGNSAFNYAFCYCSNLTSVSFSSLTTISGENAFRNVFSDCTGLISVDFPLLTTISGSYALASAFYYCSNLANIYFRALTTSSFGSYKNQFNYMMGSPGYKKHTLHFPSNMESTISGLDGYPVFGGSSSSVVCAFDLPATS